MLKIILISLLFLVSCNKKKEVITLKITAWEGYTPKFALDLFKEQMEKKYQIELKYEITLPSNEEVMLKKLAAKEAHLVVLSHYIYRDPLYRYYEKDLLHPIDLKLVSNYRHLFFPLKNLEPVIEKNKVYGTPVAHAAYRLLYNTAKVDSPPTSWGVLFDPKNKKKYIISDYHFETNSYITALYLGANKNQLNRIELYQSSTYNQEFKNLVRGSNGYWGELEKPSELVGKTYATGFGNFIHKLSKAGETWKFATPKEGEPGYIDFYSICSCVPKDSTLYKISHDWINFTLGLKYQLDVIIKGLGEMPVTVNIKPQLSKEQIQRYHLENPEYFSKTSFFWKSRTQELLRIQMKNWKDAKETD